MGLSRANSYNQNIFIKHLLSTYYFGGTILKSQNTGVNKTNYKISHFT